MWRGEARGELAVAGLVASGVRVVAVLAALGARVVAMLAALGARVVAMLVALAVRVAVGLAALEMRGRTMVTTGAVGQPLMATRPIAQSPGPSTMVDERALRYSPLDQINADNVHELEIAWQFDTGHFGPSPEVYSVSTPLMVNGTLYAAVGATRNVVALDAATGQLLWLWRPQEGERFTTAPRKGSGKGLAYYNNAGQEVIFTMTPGYYLVALNAYTGTPIETFGAGGFIDLKQGLRLGPGREDIDIGISFPPLVAGDVVVAGAAHLVGMRPIAASNVKGDIRGFDARTGELLWTFKTIPERGQLGSETWLNELFLPNTPAMPACGLPCRRMWNGARCICRLSRPPVTATGPTAWAIICLPVPPWRLTCIRAS